MKPLINTVKTIVALILIIVGLIGGLIPIFQGWVFGIPGLMLLGSVFPPVKRWTRKMIVKAKRRVKR
tara:strand:- start:3046 stop:3246 length:201 start_codon:yes stop_codon:yes gene_type:complete